MSDNRVKEHLSEDTLEGALGVRVTWRMSGNAHALPLVEAAITQGGLSPAEWGVPAVKSEKAVFATATSRFKLRRKGEGGDRELSLAPLTSARGQGEASAAINLRLVVDGKPANEFRQLAFLSCDERGEFDAELVNDTASSLVVHDDDYTAATHLIAQVEDYVERYGGKVGTDGLRTWLTDICRKAGGMPFVSSRGDWFVLNQEMLGDENPAQVILKAKDLIEKLPSSSNHVSAMVVWPSPNNLKDVRYSARAAVEGDLESLKGKLQELRDLAQEEVTGRTPKRVATVMSALHELKRRAEVMQEALQWSAADLNEELARTMLATKELTDRMLKEA